MLVLGQAEREGEGAEAKAHVAQPDGADLRASLAQTHRLDLRAALDQALAQAELIVELQGAGMDHEGTGSPARPVVLINDAKRHAVPAEPECEDESCRPGTDDQDGLGHGNLRI